MIEVEYILADLWHLQRYQAVMQRDRKKLQVLVPLIEKLLAQSKYGMVEVQDGVVLLRKAAVSKSQAMTDWLRLDSELTPSLLHK